MNYLRSHFCDVTASLVPQPALWGSMRNLGSFCAEGPKVVDHSWCKMQETCHIIFQDPSFIPRTLSPTPTLRVLGWGGHVPHVKILVSMAHWPIQLHFSTGGTIGHVAYWPSQIYFSTDSTKLSIGVWPS